MGFFSKLFGKSEPAPQPQSSVQATPKPAPKAPEPVDIDARAIISELGGKDNIASMQTCAVTRIRVELKAGFSGSEQTTAECRDHSQHEDQRYSHSSAGRVAGRSRMFGT